MLNALDNKEEFMKSKALKRLILFSNTICFTLFLIKTFNKAVI